MVGVLGSTELHTLRMLAEGPWTLEVVTGDRSSGVGRWRRLRRLLRDVGPLRLTSRLAGSLLFGRREGRRRQRVLASLFDEPRLREWWDESGITPHHVPHLNHPEARERIAGLDPDIVVRVSGGILGRGTHSLARIATLNLHHGIAPAIRGMWSIPWGLVENRPDWIGATVHVIDDGIDTGPVLWRGSPQLAPGDTGDTLLYRSHLRAVDGLEGVLQTYARGESPVALPVDAEPSAYRSAPGLWAWTRYLWLGRGRYAAATLERAVR